MPNWTLWLIAAIFVIVAIFSGVILFQVVQDIVASSPFASAASPPQINTGDSKVPISESEQEQESIENPEEEVEIVLPDGVVPQDRVTLLVLGIDQPCEFVEEPYRSDTLVLLSIDPATKSVAVLSIPRDLWVPIPGYGSQRINTAFRSGEMTEYPGGGPALAVETVEYNLGVHIHYYLTVNYDAFIQAIDLIGGIEIDVPETISDPKYPDRCYGYDPFYIEAGHYTMNGEVALKYARTRATFGADFDRADRQQEVMMAAWRTGLNKNVSLLSRAPEFWNTFADNVTTNMTYQEAVGLAKLALEIPPENIQRAVIDYNYVIDDTAPDGAQVLVPIRERIRELISSLFSPTVITTPEQDLANQMKQENAQILVLNGTWTQGMASSTAEYLKTLGFTISSVGDAEDKNQTDTQIIDYGGNTGTVNYLAQVMNVSAGNIYGGSSPDGEYDIKLVVGTDWSVPTE
ncbi:MAG: LCP family protein [Anaerolineales bacterium]|nr:LCP family protein [Anaerolineales bacterium]